MKYVYILKLVNNDYYAGSTCDLDKRIKEHKRGEVASTAKFRPHTLAWFAVFSDESLATAFEKYLKSASGKAFRNKRLV